MKGTLKDLTLNTDGTQNITITVKLDFRQEFDRLKDTEISVEIKKYRRQRSKDANAYFHVLVNKIAVVEGRSESEVKHDLVLEYGSLLRDVDGMIVGFKLPPSVDVSIIYNYAKMYKQFEEDGKLFNGYLAYKPTHECDTAEMSRLIDGAIYEAKELGIETDTPEDLARYKEEWR